MLLSLGLGPLLTLNVTAATYGVVAAVVVALGVLQFVCLAVVLRLPLLVLYFFLVVDVVVVGII